MIFWNIVLIFVLIALNGFFVGVEFAAVASRRARLDLMAEATSSAASVVRSWLENSASRDRLIAASQLGITLVSLALGAVGENTFAALLDPVFRDMRLPGWAQAASGILPALPLVISLIVVTSFHVVLGEQVPKVAVLRAPERFALTAAPVMRVFGTVFKGFISLLDWAARQVLRLMGLPDASPHSSMYSIEEIKQIVAGPEVEGVIEQPEREMLSAIFDFGELVVRQVAIPRTEIVAVEADTPLSELVATATQVAVTKLPVYEDDLDHILGVLHIRDLLGALQDPTQQTATARSLAREALYVPESVRVDDLLHEFRARQQHIAIVLDEFGGTAGLVTLEDLLEEIVGEFRDPFDVDSPSIQTQPDGTSLIDGLTLIEEINDHFGLHLYNPNYDTIAGYVMGKLGRIPQLSDIVENPEDGIRLEVVEMDGLRVSQLKMQKLT
jgi:CBS domain containing-hemolysin-like protein